MCEPLNEFSARYTVINFSHKFDDYWSSAMPGKVPDMHAISVGLLK